MQRIELNYGRGRLPVDLPDEIDLRVIRKRQMPVLPDPEAAVREALARPTGAPPLVELARGKKSACILVCDITRPVPNGLFLPVLIEQLLDAGLSPERIKVVVATGLHRPNEGEELAELIGSRWVLQTVEVANHFARDDAAHVDLGTTRAHGVPVKLDRRLVEAELKIATGLVEPHFMAGWSGGRKVIAPGVAHKDTITTFHSARFMEHPRATSCNLEGNPLHEAQLEIVEMLGGALALNTVIDEERRLSFVNFGEIVGEPPRRGQAHERIRRGAARRAVRHGGDQRRRLPARQDLLSDREGHGDADRDHGAGRRSDHCVGLLRRHGLAGVPDAQRRLVEAGRSASSRRSAQALRGHRRVADRDAAEADAHRLDPAVLGRAWTRRSGS